MVYDSLETSCEDALQYSAAVVGVIVLLVVGSIGNSNKGLFVYIIAALNELPETASFQNMLHRCQKVYLN